MIKHPLSNKLSWAKLAIGVLLAVGGILTQFDITINKTVVAKASDPKSYPAVKRSYITEAACRGIKNDTKLDDLRDRFKYNDEDSIGLILPLAEDHSRECTVYDDYNGKAEHVMMDLLVDY